MVWENIHTSSDPKDLNMKEGNSGKLRCHGEWALGRTKIKAKARKKEHFRILLKTTNLPGP